MYKPFNVKKHTEYMDAIMEHSPFVPHFLRQSEIKKAHMREVGKTDKWMLWVTVGVVLLFGVMILSAI